MQVMSSFFYFLFVLILLIILNFILNKSKIYLDINKSSFHKKITGQKQVPLTGGLVIIFMTIFFFELNDLVKIFLFLIFVIGFFSDRQKLISPNLRFLLQTVLVFLFVIYEGPKIEETRVILIDSFLDFYLFKIIFTSLCILVLLNGSNFIDGVNTNLIGYYLIVNSIILFFHSSYDFNFSINNVLILCITLFILLIFNIFNKILMGDGGAYLISLFTGFSLIGFSNLNQEISPFYVVLLLWYPAFENLFSIIRKKNLNKSPLYPDTKHLHHLIYLFLVREKKLKKNYSNSISGLLINFYNLLIFSIATVFHSHSQILIILVFFNLVVYISIYYRLGRRLARLGM